MSISLNDSYAQAFAKEIIWNFILFPVVRQINLTIIKYSLINGICKSRFVKSIYISKQKYFIISLSVNIQRRFYLNGPFSEGTGFIGADNIHASKVFYRCKPFDDHFLLSHFFCTMCQIDADNCR